MRPTEILMQEHRVIEQVLDCLDAIANKTESGEQLDQHSATQAIDFFANFADRCHHGKEEDCLFPMLEQKGFSREQGPTGVMLHEHEVGRQHVRGMSDVYRYGCCRRPHSLGYFCVSRSIFYCVASRAHSEGRSLFVPNGKSVAHRSRTDAIDRFI